MDTFKQQALEAQPQRHDGHEPVSLVAPRPDRRSRNPLLNLSIAKRLVLSFLLPALIAALALGSVGMESQQLLLQESTFYQNLMHAYTSLTTSTGDLQQMHTGLLGTLNDAAQPQPLPETLREDQIVLKRLVTDFNTILETYLQQDLLDHSPDLSALFTQAGHSQQIAQQRTYSEHTLETWRAYRTVQEQVLGALAMGDLHRAQALAYPQAESAYSDAMRTLGLLIQFNKSLVPSLHDATHIEVSRLLVITGLAIICVLLGIALVGWLISSTLVRRLQRLRQVAHAIEQGRVDTRLEVAGRDEIAYVSHAVNRMLDTLVGLLEKLQRQHEELNEANARLERLSTTDMLTGLPNHRALHLLLEKECERARRFGHPLSLLFFDGDRFKQVNDTYGHAVGDVVLRELGERARSVLRAGDTVGRFGGEEFLVLLPETGEQEALLVAERLRRGVAACPLAAREVEGGVAVTVSIGVASYPTDGATGSSVREQADQAMYWAKRLGRNQVRTAAEAARANHDAALKAATAHELERQELAALDGRDPESRVRMEQLGLIYSLMGALDWREPGMSVHAHEVSDLVVGMARELQFDEERTRHAATAAFLHDIGKIALPDRLLQQPRQHFSAREWQLLHQHAELGAAIVEASPWLGDLAPAIRHHHERWDGTGAPDGLAGEAIPLEARLIAVAEAYHSMISEQPYQAARSATDALDELERQVGTQFDPALLPVFRVVLGSRQEGVDSSPERARPDLLTQV